MANQIANQHQSTTSPSPSDSDRGLVIILSGVDPGEQMRLQGWGMDIDRDAGEILVLNQDLQPTMHVRLAPWTYIAVHLPT